LGGISGCRYSLCACTAFRRKSSNSPLHPGRKHNPKEGAIAQFIGLNIKAFPILKFLADLTKHINL
jgi:hypothetical protein